jgi:micrococcal nuclease
MIWVGDSNINLEMLKERYAEAYLEYLKKPYRVPFVRAEKEARSARKGIWSLSEYERPSNFRKRLHIGGGDG